MRSQLRAFPAWPEEWDAEYTLAARGGFMVTSSMRSSKIEFVELKSIAGQECWIRNPWPGSSVDLYRNERRMETVSGSLLRFATRKGEVIVLVPQGVSPDSFKRTVLME